MVTDTDWRKYVRESDFSMSPVLHEAIRLAGAEMNRLLKLLFETNFLRVDRGDPVVTQLLASLPPGSTLSMGSYSIDLSVKAPGRFKYTEANTLPFVVIPNTNLSATVIMELPGKRLDRVVTGTSEALERVNPVIESARTIEVKEMPALELTFEMEWVTVTAHRT